MKILFLLNFIFLFYRINCLYFHLYQGVKKCFYDELYTDVVIMVRFEILDKGFTFNTVNEKRVEITLYNVEEKKVLHKLESGKLNGKFSYTIDKSGHYKICAYSNDDDLYNRYSRLKFSLTIDTDQDEIEDHGEIVKNKDFEVVDKTAKRLVQKSNEIMKMQEFQIETEDQFSETQFLNSNRIVLMTIIQISILTVIGLWQIYSLRKVFKEKTWSPF